VNLVRAKQAYPEGTAHVQDADRKNTSREEEHHRTGGDHQVDAIQTVSRQSCVKSTLYSLYRLDGIAMQDCIAIPNETSIYDTTIIDESTLPGLTSVVEVDTLLRLDNGSDLLGKLHLSIEVSQRRKDLLWQRSIDRVPSFSCTISMVLTGDLFASRITDCRQPVGGC
jgi:hypothetical protein